MKRIGTLAWVLFICFFFAAAAEEARADFIIDDTKTALGAEFYGLIVQHFLVEGWMDKGYSDTWVVTEEVIRDYSSFSIQVPGQLLYESPYQRRATITLDDLVLEAMGVLSNRITTGALSKNSTNTDLGG
ncbi:MAG: hypothetical protein HY037_00265 [Nitrospirae bacterium]|nr:hypothetical protein [Candidatus Troglogloeales bacterium]